MLALNDPNGAAVSTARKDTREARFQRAKQDIHQRLITAMDVSSASGLKDHELRRELRRGVEDLCRFRGDLLSDAERERLINEIADGGGNKRPNRWLYEAV